MSDGNTFAAPQHGPGTTPGSTPDSTAPKREAGLGVSRRPSQSWHRNVVSPLSLKAKSESPKHGQDRARFD